MMTIQQTTDTQSSKVKISVEQAEPTETERRLAAEMIAGAEVAANDFSVAQSGQPARNNTTGQTFPYPPTN